MRISCTPESFAARSPASSAIMASPPMRTASRIAFIVAFRLSRAAPMAASSVGDFRRIRPCTCAVASCAVPLVASSTVLRTALDIAPPPISSGDVHPATSFASALSGAISAMKVRGCIAPIMFGPPPNRSLWLPSRASSAMPGSSFGTKWVR